MSGRERTIKVEELVQADTEPTTRTETVGLYTTTTTSYPLTPDMLPKPAPGETVAVADDPLRRVRQWLEDVLKAVAAIRAEPEKYLESVRMNAETCSIAVAKLHVLIREIEGGSVCNLGTVALAIERGAELAEKWQQLIVNACLEKSVKAHQRIGDTGRRNAAPHNSARQRVADDAARDRFLAWERRVRATLAGKSVTERLDVYIQTKRPPRSQRGRLRAMIRDGRIT